MSTENEEAPDEWTVLAESYTEALVPSFAPIYDVVAQLIRGDKLCRRLLDFGCGPGEPSLTLLKKSPSLQVVGVDSTKSMIKLAEKRSLESKVEQQISFHHVRRNITMEDLKKIVGTNFDVVVSSFVLHYLDFARRVEMVSTFLNMAPQVLLVTWGKQSRVGFLRAIKTFGIWKSDTTKDICNIEMSEEDNGDAESPKGSFTMSSEQNFQSIIDQAKDAQLISFETRTIPIKFSSVKTLLSFLPMSIGERDYQAMWKLLKQWNSEQVVINDTLDQELTFPTDVVFCQVSRRGTKRQCTDNVVPESKQPKT